MNKLSKLLVNWSLLAMTPFAVQAAGTYYNGSYQNPQAAQQRYNTGGYTQQQGYYQPATQGTYSNAGYSRYGQQVQQPQTANRAQPNQQQQQRAVTNNPAACCTITTLLGTFLI